MWGYATVKWGTLPHSGYVIASLGSVIARLGYAIVSWGPKSLTKKKLATSLAHPKKGTTKNAQKNPNFDFSQGRDLRQFSLLMFPYLHAKNQRICRFRSQAIWQSVHFWAIFDPKCPKKPQFWIFLANRALSFFLTDGDIQRVSYRTFPWGWGAPKWRIFLTRTDRHFRDLAQLKLGKDEKKTSKLKIGLGRKKGKKEGIERKRKKKTRGTKMMN